MTGSSSDTAVFTAGTNGTLSIVTTDAAAAAANITITADGTFEADGTTITLDSAGDIVLDADGADVIFKDGGTAIGTFTNSSSDFVLTSNVQDKDIVFKGDDGGAGITALTLDMSAAGAATFNDKIIATELDISGNMDIDGTTNLDAVDIDGAVQIDSTVTVGADDTGYDVKFFAATASKYMLWDESADSLIVQGDFYIGATAVQGAGGCTFDLESRGVNQTFNQSSHVDHNEFITYRNSGTQIGSITAPNSSATAYNTSSDYRLKENVDYSWDATTRLKQLKPARFNWIADSSNTLEDGFLAHEVSGIVPNAIAGNKDATETYTDDNGDEQTRIKPQQIDLAKLVPLLVKTIQELEARIATLEA
jgi:hypothetical protein